MVYRIVSTKLTEEEPDEPKQEPIVEIIRDDELLNKKI